MRALDNAYIYDEPVNGPSKWREKLGLTAINRDKLPVVVVVVVVAFFFSSA